MSDVAGQAARAGLRSRPAAAVRSRILHAAHDRFLASGFHRVTMEELAEELGMSKKTLYRHFPGKLDLLNAMLDMRLELIRAELDAVVREEGRGFAGRLRGGLEVMSRRLGEVKPPFVADLRRHAPDSFRRIERFRQHYVGYYFGRLLAAGRAEGKVRRDLDDRIVIEVLLNLVQSTVNPESVLRLGVSLATAFETVLQVVFEGVMTAEGRHALVREQKRGSGGRRLRRRRLEQATT